MNEETKVGPPNPFYFREWKCSTTAGHAHLSIQAPGGKIEPDVADDVVEWLELVLRQLKRYATIPTPRTGETT